MEWICKEEGGGVKGCHLHYGLETICESLASAYVCGEGVLMESITFPIHRGICSFNGKISLCRRFYFIKILIKKLEFSFEDKFKDRCL